MCFRPPSFDEMMKKCPNCGAFNPPENTKCKQCGTDISEVVGDGSSTLPGVGAPGAPKAPSAPGAPKAPGAPSAPKAPGA